MNNSQNNNYNGNYNNNYNDYNNGNNQGYPGQEYNNYNYQENYQSSYDNQNYQMNNNYDNQMNNYDNQMNNYDNQNNYYQDNNYQNNQNTYSQPQSEVTQYKHASCLQHISNLTAIDPSFNEHQFKDFALDLYYRLQAAWTMDLREGTWNNDIRQYMTDDLFNFYSKQLQRLKRKNQENVIKGERIMATIEGYKELTNYDMIVVRYSGFLIDYVIDLNTGKLMIGSKSESVRINETFIFIRTKNMRNPEMMKTYNCVYCGAGLTQGSNRCEYCGGINVVDNSPNWVLCKAVKGENYKYQGGKF